MRRYHGYSEMERAGSPALQTLPPKQRLDKKVIVPCNSFLTRRERAQSERTRSDPR